ncbi:MAG: S9 family peptidase [Bryobacteraceae bacterium]
MLQPPIAKRAPARLEKHGHVRMDDYYWLRDRENPEVTAYLDAENAYTEATLAHTEPLQATLVQEFKERIKQSDASVPYKKDGAYFYSRTEEGRDYPIYCRKLGSQQAPEEILVDVNVIAQGQEFCSVATPHTSPDQRLMVYAADLVGRRIYNLHLQDLETGQQLETIREVTANAVWAADNRTLFYVRQDADTLRPYQVWRHTAGTDPVGDVLVYAEDDETFGVGVGRTKSGEFIVVITAQTVTTEVRYLRAAEPESELKVFLPRKRMHEYGVDHAGGEFYIRTNYEARNFRVMKTSDPSAGLEAWTEVLPHREDTYLEDFDLFRGHIAVTERKEGLLQLRIMARDGGDHYLDFGEPAYVAHTSANFDYDTTLVRYGYSSMTTPPSTYDYDMVSRERVLLKREEVGGGFDPANYRTERVWVTARDGVRVPVSLVYRMPFEKDGTRPLVLYGYGSYGYSLDASFNAYRVSLLDRGFVWAIAHIRGGEELGRQWYDDGRLLKKKNTFHDFIDCAVFLKSEGYGGELYSWGGSAGGLLMGAVMTMRPDLFAGMIAEVPFVDVVTTMLDDSIPLTTSEYDEWGNPNEKAFYDYMLSYSPYDQTRPAAYPHLLITSGLHDSQVQYWEPAKWVAKMRTMRQNDNLLLLHTEMRAGHGGLTARDDRYRETALRYAFLIDVARESGL